MKKIYLQEESKFTLKLKIHNKGLKIFITNMITTLIIIFILLSTTDFTEPNAFFKLLMYCLFIAQLISVYGIIFAMIQFINLKKLNFNIKQKVILVLGFVLNIVWFSGFLFIVLSALKDILNNK